MLNRINTSIKTDLYSCLKDANIEKIKVLDQTDRKTLLVMVRSLNRGNDDIDLNPEKIELIKHKFQTPATYKGSSSLLKRIIKGVMNFLHLRISSSKLKREIDLFTTEMKEKIEKAKTQINKDLENAKDSLKESEDWAKNQIFGEKLQDINNEGHLRVFEVDYLRIPPEVEISDDKKGTFQGLAKINDKANQERLKFVYEGMANIFDTNLENEWLHLTEAAISQTPYNYLVTPIIANTLINPDKGTLKNIEFDRGPILSAKVDVVRDENNTIKELNITNTYSSKVILSQENVSLGYIAAALSYTARLQDGVVKIDDFLTECNFSETPFVENETKTPGFHPLNE